MYKNFYTDFEAEFRGSNELITSRLKGYCRVLDDLRSSEIGSNIAIDLGCGRGEWLQILTENGFVAKGVDLDSEMLASCIENGHEVYNEDALAFLRAQDSSTCALISAFHVIEHLDFEVFYNLVEECYRVLVPGGIVIIETPNSENIYVASNTFFLDPTHVRIVPSDLVKYVLKTNNFYRSVAIAMQAPAFNKGYGFNFSEAFFGIGYDVGVVAQKQSDKTDENSLDVFFDSAVEQRLHSRLDHASDLLNAKIKKIEGELEELNEVNSRLEAVNKSQATQLASLESKVNMLSMVFRKIRFPMLTPSRIWNKLVYLVYRNKPIRHLAKLSLRPFPKVVKMLSKYIYHIEIERGYHQPATNLAVTSERVRYVYVDITGLHVNDIKTGIQRVARTVLKNLYGQLPDRYSIVPVHANKHKVGFRHAVEFELDLVGSNASNLNGNQIVPEYGDIFIGLDFQVTNVFRNSKFFHDLCSQGMKVFFVLYDLLPVDFPQFFEDNVRPAHEEWLKYISRYSGVLCISRSVQERFRSWQTSNNIETKKNFLLANFVLGHDFLDAPASKGLPDDFDETMSVLSSKTSAITVGTLEPRKGHSQILDAYEHLWSSGARDVLVIVGKRGWKVQGLVKRIEEHPLKNKNLFWFEQATDEFLDELYQVSDYFIAASYGEGFGLPLVEASHYGVPIFARNIDIFKEVMGESASYFSAKDGVDLYIELAAFSSAVQNGEIKADKGKAFATWRESAKMFSDLISN